MTRNSNLNFRIPDPYEGEFSRRGYNKRPVFFGCDMTNTSLIIYLPNHYVVAPTDAPTMQMQFRVCNRILLPSHLE